eukprot:jgi/Psemu1/306639/fgenesh1_kg.270_\
MECATESNGTESNGMESTDSNQSMRSAVLQGGRLLVQRVSYGAKPATASFRGILLLSTDLSSAGRGVFDCAVHVCLPVFPPIQSIDIDNGERRMPALPGEARAMARVLGQADTSGMRHAGTDF